MLVTYSVYHGWRKGLDDMTDEQSLAVIEDQADASIRRIYLADRWYFSVIDVVGVLTDSPNPRNYWNMLKRRLTDEGASETYTNCVQLKMTAADGKQRTTDAADMATMLRIIQSVPSPKAEPVKQWLAKVGAERLSEHLREAAQPLAPAERETAIAAVPQPAAMAPALEWARYHEQLATLFRRAAVIETTLAEHDAQIAELHDRMESAEAGLSLLPEILERLGPVTLSPEHQRTAQSLAKRLHDVGGFAYPTIYTDLGQSFHVGKYDQIPDDRWPEVAQWFQARIAAAEKRGRRE